MFAIKGNKKNTMIFFVNLRFKKKTVTIFKQLSPKNEKAHATIKVKSGEKKDDEGWKFCNPFYIFYTLCNSMCDNIETHTK